MQSPGLGVNLVTKSGTDRLRGSGRYYLTDDSMQSNNVTEEMRSRASTPATRSSRSRTTGSRWAAPEEGPRVLWGSYGRQDINVGINNFYKADANCQAMKKNPWTTRSRRPGRA